MTAKLSGCSTITLAVQIADYFQLVDPDLASSSTVTGPSFNLTFSVV